MELELLCVHISVKHVNNAAYMCVCVRVCMSACVYL